MGTWRTFGLPKPDHKLLEAHPTISAELLDRIGHGRIKVKPNIERLEGDNVRFADGTVEKIDRIVYCTGYRITFPFLRARSPTRDHNRIDLWRRVVPPGPRRPLLHRPGAAARARSCRSPRPSRSWSADLLEGTAALPDAGGHAARRSSADWARMQTRYVRSDRHTIQVDFHPHLRDIARARKVRKGRSVALPAASGRTASREPARVA